MYKIREIELEELLCFQLESPNGRSKVQIVPGQGGRLSSLVFNNISIIENYDAATYKEHYASSILFPFANRIKNGEYTFNDLQYNLDCNEIDKNNALHGLVYNKTFVVKDSLCTLDYASVTLQYKDYGNTKGFPFKFNIELNYILNSNGIILSIKVLNKDKKTFPFSIGWHPYFYSENIAKSSINFRSNTKYVWDKQQIISGSVPLEIKMPFQLKDIKLDDCYLLKTNEVDFSTPEYSFNIRSTAQENFLQLYTPNRANVIAIEPMTGVADSFNNEIGLQTLPPKTSYVVKWFMAIDTLNTITN